MIQYVMLFITSAKEAMFTPESTCWMVCWLIGLLSLETSSVGLIVGLSAGLFRNSTNLVFSQNRTVYLLVWIRIEGWILLSEGKLLMEQKLWNDVIVT